MQILETGLKILYNYIINSTVKDVIHMKPRIFISSTFYDLKYIREDLANFVKAHDYEPIMFEDGDIGYTPGQPLDTSCYEAMRNSDMVILIIGGEYGSAANGEKKDVFNEYMSVTRNEFRTAIENGIPVFVMIDKKVMAEYEVYEVNYNVIENEKSIIKFPFTKNINVFRFIREVKNIVNLPIKEFEKSADIKGFISKQWADMFKNYLRSLRNENGNKKIQNSVDDMKSLIQKMDIMMDSVGKNVLSKEDPEEYKNVINQQEILSFCDVLVKRFKFKCNIENYSSNKCKAFVSTIIDCLKQIDTNNWNEVGSKLFNQLHFNGYKVSTIQHNEKYNKLVISKLYLIHNEKSVEKIIEIMSSEEYFSRMFY